MIPHALFAQSKSINDAGGIIIMDDSSCPFCAIEKHYQSATNKLFLSLSTWCVPIGYLQGLHVMVVYSAIFTVNKVNFKMQTLSTRMKIITKNKISKTRVKK